MNTPTVVKSLDALTSSALFSSDVKPRTLKRSTELSVIRDAGIQSENRIHRYTHLRWSSLIYEGRGHSDRFGRITKKVIRSKPGRDKQFSRRIKKIGMKLPRNGSI